MPPDPSTQSTNTPTAAASRSNALLVLGMHRSGTSLMANILRDSGVSLGEDLLGASEGNPHGHFEDKAVLAFHERVLARLRPENGLIFDNGSLVVDPKSVELLPEERDEALAMVQERHRDTPWGWKDPRTCLFLRFWEELLGPFRSVIIYRHPLEVADSFLRRGNNYDQLVYPEQFIQAYGVYNRELIRLQQADPGRHLVLHANAAFTEPERLAESLSGFTGLTINAADVASRFHGKDFQTLRVSEPLHEAFAAIYPEEAKLFETLQELAVWSQSLAPADDESESTREAATRVLALAESLPGEARVSLHGVMEFLASRRSWSDLREDREAIAEAVRRMLAHERSEHERIVRGWLEQNDIIEALVTKNEEIGENWTRQKEIIEEQSRKMQTVWDELVSVGKSWEHQKDLLNKWQDTIHNLEAQLEQRDKTIEELQQKLSRHSSPATTPPENPKAQA